MRVGFGGGEQAVAASDRRVHCHRERLTELHAAYKLAGLLAQLPQSLMM